MNINFKEEYKKAYNLEKNKQYYKAIKFYERLLKDHNNNKKLLYQSIGACNYYLGKPKEAIKYFKKAIDSITIRQNHQDYLVLISCIFDTHFFSAKNYNGAAETLKQYKNENPKGNELFFLYNRKGLLYLKKADYRNAEDFFYKATRIKYSKNPILIAENYYYLGYSLIKNNNIDKAKKLINKLINKKDDNLKCVGELIALNLNDLGYIEKLNNIMDTFYKNGFGDLYLYSIFQKLNIAKEKNDKKIIRLTMEYCKKNKLEPNKYKSLKLEDII